MCALLEAVPVTALAGALDCAEPIARQSRTSAVRLASAWGGYRFRAGATLVAAAPRGRRAFTSEGSHVVRVWELPAGRQLRVVFTPVPHATALASSAEGARFAVGGADGTVAAFDAATGALLHVFEREPGEITALALADDGQRVLAGTETGLLRVYDLARGERTAVTRAHKDLVRSIAVAPSSARAWSAGDDGVARAWALPALEPGPSLEADGARPIRAVEFFPDGRRVLAAVDGEGILVLDATEGRRRWLVEEAGEVLALAAPTAASWAVAVRRRSPSSGEPLVVRRFKGAGDRAAAPSSHGIEGASTAAFCLDGALIVGTDEGGLRFLAAGRAVASPPGHAGSIASVAYARARPLAVTGARDGTVRLWDARRGRERFAWRVGGRDPKFVALSSDGSVALAAAAEGSLRLFDASSGRELRALGPHRGLVAAAFAADGRRLVTASYDRLATWEWRTGRELGSTAHPTLATHVAFAPDGSGVLISMGRAGEQLRDLAGAASTLRTFGTAASATALAVSRSSRRVAIARAGDGESKDTIELWEAGQEARVGTFEARSRPEALAFSPSGDLLLAAGDDGVVRLFAADDGRELDRFELWRNGEHPTALGFAPDGGSFLVGTSLGGLLEYLIVRDPLAVGRAAAP